MRKKRIIPDPMLMLVTILIVTGFQVYWLENNYEREKRDLQIKANMAFQDAIRHLQTEKLKLRDPFLDTSQHRKMRVIVNRDVSEPDMAMHKMPIPEIITMVNAVRDKLRDSLKDRRTNSAIIVSIGEDSNHFGSDSLHGKLVTKDV